ncbi:MAG: hypothetical protein AAF492_18200, partial [Verrucomicrobiota bacterium]
MKQVALLLCLLPWTVMAQETNRPPPEWSLFLDPSQKQDYRWISEFRSRVEPMHEAKIDARVDQGYVTLKGLYSVKPPDFTRKTLRLKAKDGHITTLNLFFETAKGWYQIMFFRESPYPLVASHLKGPPDRDPNKRVYRRITDDEGRWMAYRDGRVDIRYDNGRMMLARGTIELLSFPMPEPPHRMIMEVDGHLSLFQSVELPPLEPTESPLDLRPEDTTWNWTLDSRYFAREKDDPAQLIHHPDDTVELSMEKAREDRTALAPFTISNPGRLTVEVRDLSHGSGFRFPGPYPLTLRFAEQDEYVVLCNDPFNQGDVNHHALRGYRVAPPFRCRMTYGLDYVQLDISDAEKDWWMFKRVHISYHHRVSPLHLDLTLQGRAPDEKQFIRIAPPVVENIRLLDRFFDPHALFGQPGDASDTAWSMACNLAILNRWTSAGLKQKAADDTLRHLTHEHPEPAGVLEAIRSIPAVMKPPRWGGQSKSLDYNSILRELSQRMMAREELDGAGAWLDQWYRLGFDEPRLRQQRQRYAPPDLIRAHLYELYRT